MMTTETLLTGRRARRRQPKGLVPLPKRHYQLYSCGNLTLDLVLLLSIIY